MKKYLVTVPYTVLVNVEVVAASEEEAKEFAVPLATLINYHSNGGTKKLIGPLEDDLVNGDVTVEPVGVDRGSEVNVEVLEDYKTSSDWEDYF